MMLTFHISFPTPLDSIENLVTDKKSGEVFVKDLLMILHRIDCEKDTEVSIDLTTKKKFIDDFKALEKLLNVKIRIGSYDLEESINNFISANDIKILADSIVRPDYHFSIINSFFEIDSIFTTRNQSRNLNRNDFRHCENHPQRIHSKSPLIGGQKGFDNAKNHLSSAIGDAKTNRNILINIDTINQDFVIRYEDENFNNQYHAYHIAKRKSDQYVVDDKELRLLNNSRTGIPRAYKIINYRRKKRTNE